MTIAEALRAAAVRLEHSSSTARLDAELLMAHAFGVTRSDLLLRQMDAPAPDSFDALLERRTASEPVAYIVGHQEFYGLPFAVTPDVLIPRADSETLVEHALATRPDAKNVLDCGTGSGALLLAVLHHLPESRGVGIDASQAALTVALANAEALELANRTRMLLADWTEPGWTDNLGGPFDLILGNPPYVETGAAVEPDVRDYEPSQALFAGEDGLDDYRALIPQLPALMAPDGMAFVEIGFEQAAPVSDIARTAGLTAVLHRDLANRPRVLQLSTRT